MKRFEIEWETDFCEDYPELHGYKYIMAETEDEAVSLFYKNRPHFKALVMGVREV